MSKRRLQPEAGDNTLSNPFDGPILPSHKLQCYSVACLDMPQLEFGDKIVLPPNILLELQCLKIPTPLLFMVQAADLDIQLDDNLDSCSRQYCSVQEFSASNGQVFLPYWLMQNLRVPEGGSVVVTSIVDLPRGIYCRLQPESMDFLDLAAEIGPKLLMETALRRYSVLSVNSSIVIEYGNVRYYVRVAELKPAPVVSLCGDVNLETNFMPPEVSDPKRPSTATSTVSNENISVQPSTPGPSPIVDEKALPDNSTPVIGYGRRLRDGGYVETETSISQDKKAVRNIPFSSLQRAQQIIRDKQTKTISTKAVASATDSSVLAVQLRSAQRAFSTTGYTLGTAPPTCISSAFSVAANFGSQSSNSAVDPAPLAGCCASSSDHKCQLCLAVVSSINMELHTLRCAKNSAYHKFECSTCHEEILRVNENQHQHCPNCTILCESTEALAEHQHEEHTASCKCTFCGVLFTRTELQDHVDNDLCEHVLVPCSLCGLAFKKTEMTQHSHMCCSRTERCDKCKSYIKITEFGVHQEQCGVFPTQQKPTTSRPDATINFASAQPPSRTNSSNQNAIECAYCLRGGFPDIAAVEQHVLRDCRIAKSFTAHELAQIASTNQENVDQPEASSSEDVKEPHCEEIIRPLLAQGRMRRKGDTSAIHSSSSSRPQADISNNNQVSHLLAAPSTLLSTTRLAQSGKLRKAKPRLNPQLRSLPQRIPKPVSTPGGLPANDKSIFADLCISSAGGTSHGALAGPSRSRATTRARRRPTANLPTLGRLDKLP